MRNFVVTIDGKSYSVGVEEVGLRVRLQTVKRFYRRSPDLLKTFLLPTAPQLKKISPSWCLKQ